VFPRWTLDMALSAERIETLALCLARGQSRQAAASECKIAVRSVYNGLQDPAFKARVAELRGELVSAVVSRLAGLASKAVETLGDALDDEDVGVRIRAATAVLDRLIKLGEFSDLADRLAAVEEALAERRSRRGWPRG
jgi:hypothetical protein